MIELVLSGPAEGDLVERARAMVRIANLLGISVGYANGYNPAVQPGDDPYDIAEQWRRAEEASKV